MMKNGAIFVYALLWLMPVFGQTKLQYNLKAGEVYTVKQEANQIISQELDGAIHELNNNISGLLEFKVISETDSTFNIDFEFKDLNMLMTSSIQGELMKINAKEVQNSDVQSKIYNSLLNEPFHMVLGKNGDILQVTGGDSLVAKMSRATGIEDEFTLNMMKKSLEKEFGSEALSNSYEQMTFIYPNVPVDIGDNWKNKYSGKLAANNTWTLEQLTDSTASISGEASVVMDVSEPASTLKLSGVQSTRIETDLLSGFIISMKVEGNSKGVTFMTQMGDQEIPTTISSTTTYTLIR